MLTRTQIPFTSLQFPLYELLKLRLARILHRPLHAYEAAVCGSFSGGVAAALTTPLDVLKTRVMLDLRVCTPTLSDTCHMLILVVQDPTKHQRPTLAARFRDIYVNEGAKALFAGVVPRTLWISAGGAVFLGVYEWAAQSLMGQEPGRTT